MMDKHLRSNSLKKQYDAIGVIEIILILVVLIGLVIIFKSELSEIIANAFEAITGNADQIIG